MLTDNVNKSEASESYEFCLTQEGFCQTLVIAHDLQDNDIQNKTCSMIGEKNK